MVGSEPVHFETSQCSLTITTPYVGVFLLVLMGRDVGELGDAPFKALARRLTGEEPVELFIDARAATGATLEVSGAWALWLGANKRRFRHVSMLTGSRFIQMTAGIVKGFSELGDAMRLYTEPQAFAAALHDGR
jgi:hypothetical protein